MRTLETKHTHYWQATTSPSVQRCGCVGCQATRKVIRGVWTEQPANPPKPAISVPQQTGLWGGTAR